MEGRPKQPPGPAWNTLKKSRLPPQLKNVNTIHFIAQKQGKKKSIFDYTIMEIPV